MGCFKWKNLVYLAKKDNFPEILWEYSWNNTLNRILPEVAILDEFVHRPQYHQEGNPLDHTLKVVKLSKIMDFEPIVSICCLLHDIGKCNGFNYEVKGYHNFFNHDLYGCEVFSGLSKRLEIPKKDAEKINFVIRQHQRYGKMDSMRKYKKEKLENNKFFPLLEKVCYCDYFCRFPNDYDISFS